MVGELEKVIFKFSKKTKMHSLKFCSQKINDFEIILKSFKNFNLFCEATKMMQKMADSPGRHVVLSFSNRMPALQAHVI